VLSSAQRGARLRGLQQRRGALLLARVLVQRRPGAVHAVLLRRRRLRGRAVRDAAADGAGDLPGGEGRPARAVRPGACLCRGLVRRGRGDGHGLRRARGRVWLRPGQRRALPRGVRLRSLVVGLRLLCAAQRGAPVRALRRGGDLVLAGARVLRRQVRPLLLRRQGLRGRGRVPQGRAALAGRARGRLRGQVTLACSP